MRRKQDGLERFQADLQKLNALEKRLEDAMQTAMVQGIEDRLCLIGVHSAREELLPCFRAIGVRLDFPEKAVLGILNSETSKETQVKVTNAPASDGVDPLE